MIEMKIISRQYAREKKLRRYYTGITCKNGHLSQRSTNTGACLACLAASNHRKYLQKAAKWSRYRLGQPEPINIKAQVYHEDDYAHAIAFIEALNFDRSMK